MGARNRVEIVVVIPAGQAPQPGGIGSLESIHGHLKSLKIRTQYSTLKTSGGRLLVMVFLALMMPSLKSSLSGARVCNCVQIILLKVLRVTGRKPIYSISVSNIFRGTSLPPTPNWGRFDHYAHFN
jgi:hypothetical protein